MSAEEQSVGQERPNNPGAFKGKDDPRRSIGRPAGIPNKTTRAALALIHAHAEELVTKVIGMTEPVAPDAEPCPMCGRGMKRPEEVRLKAAFGLLDRGGIGPSSKVEVTECSDTVWMQYTTDEELATIAGIAEAARARMPIPDTSASEEDQEQQG